MNHRHNAASTSTGTTTPNDAADEVYLSGEVITEMLLFLEVKDLMRMKCVCKSWNTIISDPIFAKMHLKKKERRKIQHLALVDVKPGGSGYCTTIPISRLQNWYPSSLSESDLPYHCRFNYGEDRRDIVGSCNGLVCLQGRSDLDDEYAEYSLSFWNPATMTKSDTLASFRSCRETNFRFAFGYDISTDTFKGVMLIWIFNLFTPAAAMKITARVFTFGGDNNAWRDIQCFPKVDFDFDPPVYLNNSINWLVYNLITQQFVVLSLDLGTETCTQMLLPQSFIEEKLSLPWNNPLFVLMDCMCFSCDFMKTHFIVWKMDEFGVEKSWTRFIKISYMNLQIDHNFRQLTLLCMSEDGDTLIFSYFDQVIVYNWRTNRVNRKIKIFDQTMLPKARAYVESLLSTDF